MNVGRSPGGPVAVVTGAGSGIGRAIATALLRAEFRVALLGRHRDTLEATSEAVPAGRGASLVLPTDVTVDAEVAAAVEAVVHRWGRLDVLVNNAGTFGPRGAVDEVAPEEFRRTLEVNLTGAFLCTHHAVRAMKAQDPRGGRIINNGSISAHVPRPRSVAYTASKHAMTGLTRATALDGREHAITCGQIDIGNAHTDMTADLRAGGGSDTAGGGSDTAGGAGEPTFDVVHVADAVLALARLPLGVSVPSMTIVATGMPYGGRG